MNQKKVLVEEAVTLKSAVAAGGSRMNAADNFKRMVMGEGVAVSAGSAGIAAVDTKAAADSETVAGSKSSQTLGEEQSSSQPHFLVVAVHWLLLLWRSPSTVASCRFVAELLS